MAVLPRPDPEASPGRPDQRPSLTGSAWGSPSDRPGRRTKSLAVRVPPSVLSRREWQFLPSAVTWPPFPGGGGEEVNMLIGYARISNVGVGLDVQKDALDKANVDRLFVDDEASWAKAKFPQWELALSRLHKGDTLVVWRLDRLGQGLGRLIGTIEDLGSRGIGFQSLNDSIDTTTGTSR